MENKIDIQRVKNYCQKDEFKAWLRQDPIDNLRVYCHFCQMSLTVTISTLRRHATSKIHKRITMQPMEVDQEQVVVDEYKKEKNIAYAAFLVADSSSFSFVDDLRDYCMNQFNEDIKIDQQKCSLLIRNVLGIHFKEKLRKDIGVSMFSLQLDGSQTKQKKLLSIVITYCSAENKKQVTTLLNVVFIKSTDAITLDKTVREELISWNLSLSNLVAISSDNAYIATGTFNSLHSLLKASVPNLKMVRCSCHLIQLVAVEVGEKCLPLNIVKSIRHTYKYFKQNALQRDDFTSFYEVNNKGKTRKITPISSTKWLSITDAVCRILEQWTELKTFFHLQIQNGDKDETLTELHSFYDKDFNYFYMFFVEPILIDIDHLLKLCQHKDKDVNNVLDHFHEMMKWLKNLSESAKFSVGLENILETMNFSVKDEVEIRKTCRKFVTDTIDELYRRMPYDILIYKNIQAFSMQNVLNSQEDITPVLRFFNEQLNEKEIKTLNEQYKTIQSIVWNNVDNITFWFDVLEFEELSGRKPFTSLAHFAISLFCFPVSNVEVERSFAQVKIIMSRRRNSIKTDTLSALLHIKYGLRNAGKTSQTYVLPNECYERIRLGYKRPYCTNFDNL